MANYPIKYVIDENGNRCLPLTHIDAVKDDSGTSLRTLLSQLSTPIVAPVNQSDATLPITALVCEIGKYYRIDVAVETLDVTLPAVSGSNVLAIVLYLTGGTTPSITISSADSATIVYHKDYEIEASKTYEVNCLWNGAAWVIASVEIVIPTNEGE